MLYVFWVYFSSRIRDRDIKSTRRIKYLHGKVPNHHYIVENGINYNINFDDSSNSTGINIEHRNSRIFVYNLVRQLKNQERRNLNLLNIFAGTCTMSCAAGVADPQIYTLNIDQFDNPLYIGKENIKINNLDLNNHKFWVKEVGQALKVLNQEKKKLYDIVIVDPPTVTTTKIKPKKRDLKDKKKLPMKPLSKTFELNKGYSNLICYAGSLVKPGGYLITMSTTHSLKHHKLIEYTLQGFDELKNRIKNEIKEERYVNLRMRLRKRGTKKRVRLRIVNQLDFTPEQQYLDDMYRFTEIHSVLQPSDFPGSEENMKIARCIVWKREPFTEKRIIPKKKKSTITKKFPREGKRKFGK